MNRLTILLACFILVGSLQAANWTMSNGGVYWAENGYTISAYPATSNELINHFQYVNFTSANPASIMTNLSFVFDVQPISGDVLLWQNTSHQVNVPHTTRMNGTYTIVNVSDFLASAAPCSIGDDANLFKYNVSYNPSNNGTTWGIACFDSYTQNGNDYTINYSYNSTAYTSETRYWMDWGSILYAFTYTNIAGHHVYTINDVPFNGNTAYQTKFLYSFPIGSSGKFDIYAHQGSPSQVVAGTAPIYVRLDPWWNAVWNNKQQINTTNWNCNFAYCQFPINFSSSKTNGTDIRVLNATEDGTLPFYRESGNWSAATAKGNLWVNASNNTASIWIYYNASGVSDASNGNATFSSFDDFNGAFGGWEGDTANGTTAGGILNYSTNQNNAWKIAKSTSTFTAGQSVVMRIYMPIFAYGYQVAGAGGLGTGISSSLNETAISSSGGALYYMQLNTTATALGNLSSKWLGFRAQTNTANATYYLDYKTRNTTIAGIPIARAAVVALFGGNGEDQSILLEWYGYANMNDAFPTFAFGTEQNLTLADYISITQSYPTSVAYISNSSINVNYTVNLTMVQDTTVKLFISGVLNQTNTTAGNATFSIPTVFSDGNYSWYVLAYNTSNSSMNITGPSTSFTIDTAKPSGLALSIIDGYSYLLNQSINLTFTETNFKNCTISINSTQYNMVTINATTCQYNLTGINNYTIYGIVNDLAGNSQNSSVKNITIFNYSSTIFSFSNPQWDNSLDNMSISLTTSNFNGNLSVNLSYNGAILPASVVRNGNAWNASYLVSPPVGFLGNNTTISFNWTVGFNPSTALFTVANSTLVMKTDITNCVNKTQIFQFIFYHQDNGTSAMNSTMDAMFNFTNAASGISYVVSGTWAYPQHIIQVCLSAANNTVFQVSSVQQFTAPGFDKLYYYLVNQTVITNNISINTSLYNINSSLSTLMQYQVLEGANQPVVNAYVQILRYYPSTNQLILVSMGKTDENGFASSYVIPNTVNYQYIIIKNSQIYYTSNLAILSCDPSSTICQHTILINAGGNNPYQAFVGATGVGCWVNNATAVVYCTSNNPSGTGSDITLNLWEMTTYGKTLVCTNTISSGSGTVLCAIPDMSKSYYYEGTTSIGSWIDIGRGTINVVMDAKFDATTGLFATALVIIVFAVVGMVGGLGTSILAATFGLVFAAMFGFYSIGLEALSGIIVVGMVLAFVLRQ
jgi:hypothetical protein